MKRTLAVIMGLLLTYLVGCGEKERVRTAAPAGQENATAVKETDTMAKVVKSDAEWKKELTPEQYRILREKDTEPAFTGKYWKTMEDGEYRCAGCGLVLFRSDGKFVSECGWPAFSEPAPGTKLTTTSDNSFGMSRTEVTCPRCGGHLGHVFTDGPGPTGLRYCINSGALKFDPKKPAEK